MRKTTNLISIGGNLNMDEQKIRVIKASDPEELIVFRASSLENQIRFYINEDTYFVAEETKDKKFSLDLRKSVPDQNSESKLSFKNKLKNLLNALPLIILSSAVVAVITGFFLFLATFINSTLLCVFIFNIVWLTAKMICVLVLETKTTSPSLKSKHSAEHMMVNFLEKYKRLPKSIEELKKSSRFASDCGSRKIIKGFTEDFLSFLFGGIILIIADYFLSSLLENIIVYTIILVLIYILGYFLSSIVLKKCKKIQFVVGAIENLLNNIVQCANTTKKVKDIDLVLAYFAAKAWMLHVYPEFYNEKEDTFVENLLEE